MQGIVLILFVNEASVAWRADSRLLSLMALTLWLKGGPFQQRKVWQENAFSPDVRDFVLPPR